jgi:hypothetical protein
LIDNTKQLNEIEDIRQKIFTECNNNRVLEDLYKKDNNLQHIETMVYNNIHKISPLVSELQTNSYPIMELNNNMGDYVLYQKKQLPKFVIDESQ